MLDAPLPGDQIKLRLALTGPPDLHKAVALDRLGHALVGDLAAVGERGERAHRDALGVHQEVTSQGAAAGAHDAWLLACARAAFSKWL